MQALPVKHKKNAKSTVREYNPILHPDTNKKQDLLNEFTIAQVEAVNQAREYASVPKIQSGRLNTNNSPKNVTVMKKHSPQNKTKQTVNTSSAANINIENEIENLH